MWARRFFVRQRQRWAAVVCTRPQRQVRLGSKGFSEADEGSWLKIFKGPMAFGCKVRRVARRRAASRRVLCVSSFDAPMFPCSTCQPVLRPRIARLWRPILCRVNSRPEGLEGFKDAVCHTTACHLADGALSLHSPARGMSAQSMVAKTATGMWSSGSGCPWRRQMQTPTCTRTRRLRALSSAGFTAVSQSVSQSGTASLEAQPADTHFLLGEQPRVDSLQMSV